MRLHPTILPGGWFYFMPRAIVFANGFLANPESVRRLINPADLLIAADGGTRHALSFGLTPSVIIGDLDSLVEADRQLLEKAGTRVIQFPRDKNETDLELAINFSIEQGCTEIIIVAALGGRLDQTLGNLSLLTGPRPAALDIRLDDGVEEVFFVRGSSGVHGAAGDIVSLLPWGGEVTCVCTDGLRWTLRGETLYPHKTRGISNELLGGIASIEIKSGLLLVVHRRLS